ncbi:SDR family NAD(P)-dependent oxidoreductase [Sphingobium chlorophenolicum]|uniref:3-oxoacyl-(Acyl-carrier-protein) reductase n=1 Tax=Sphingobium chlorophenolicum TaxID=46429 RepID=A0A081RFD4_SPHCR|nr:SDR family oxidoreductase [Sphingobium chlorophenolicum]KEQ53907.1 hypothetical protein BV95_01779 [Sphingobium chlorophenolicum]
MSLHGKTAFVTGAARGIGETLSRALAAEGAKMALIDIDLSATRAVAESIEAAGGQALAIKCDVTDMTAIEAATQQVSSHFGGIDILINNAALHGIEYNIPSTQLPMDAWSLLLDVNLLGPVRCAKACRGVMRARGGGVIINLSSIASMPALNAYGVSKLAVRGLTTALAHELAADGIRVYALVPGLMDTEAVMSEAPPGFVEDVHKKQLIQRQGSPRDLVGAVLFFCSDAASFITGETLTIAGGAPLRT